MIYKKSSFYKVPVFSVAVVNFFWSILSSFFTSYFYELQVATLPPHFLAIIIKILKRVNRLCYPLCIFALS